MAEIAVVGPGAIGCTVAAWLAQGAAHRLTVLARQTLAGIVVQTPGGALQAEPRIVTDALALQGCEWVLVATKAYDAVTVAATLAPLAGGPACIAILQNGVEHLEHFTAGFAPGQLLPVMVDIPALRTAPGRVTQHRKGRMCVPQGELGERFVQLFAHTDIDVVQSPDFKTEIWKKLCVNAAGAFSAVLLKPAVIARHAGVAALMERVIREVIAVGRAEGADLDAGLAASIVDGYRQNPSGINSMHADRLAGRSMEIEARNGVIVRLGRRHGIPTPTNEMIVALLEASLLDAG